MAASVISIPGTSIDGAINDESRLSPQAEHDEELEWVLPSEVDCLGRPLSTVAFTAMLRSKFSFSSIRSFIASLRQPAF